MMATRVNSISVHTLGPAGTNCEAAAHHWLDRRGERSHDVVLHDSLEKAVVAVLSESRASALLGCIVYPRLHEIVFQNLNTLMLRDCFVLPTHRMVLAARAEGGAVASVASHPAPVDLLRGMAVEILLAGSNSQAALSCAQGEADACVTTSVAAEAEGLHVLRDFGPVPMGFSIHTPHWTEI